MPLSLLMPACYFNACFFLKHVCLFNASVFITPVRHFNPCDFIDKNPGDKD